MKIIAANEATCRNLPPLMIIAHHNINFALFLDWSTSLVNFANLLTQFITWTVLDPWCVGYKVCTQ